MANYYNPTSRSKQTTNFRPYYPDNRNAFMDSEVKDAQNIGLNLATENPIGAGIVNALINGVLGDGLKLESYIKRELLKDVDSEIIEKTQKTIESYWDIWSKSPTLCDHYQKNDLSSIETIALRSIIGEGDGLLHIKIAKEGDMFFPQIQWINGSMIATPPDKFGQVNILSGVEVDSQGRDTAYYVKQMNGNSIDIDYKRCPVYSKTRNSLAFQMVRFNEIQQGIARGRSLLIPCKDLIIQIDRFTQAEITKAIIQSLMTFFITQDKESDDTTPDTLEDIVRNSSLNEKEEVENSVSNISSTTENIMHTMNGSTIVALNPGEKIELPESNAPTANFKEFINTILVQIGMSVNIPSDVLQKSFNSSYSSSQASLQEAARGYKSFRGNFITKFMNPIYEAFVDCLILQGVIECKGYEDNIFLKKAWTNASWNPPTILNIDPLKNVKAYDMAVKSNFITREQASQELYGNKWESTIIRLADEKKKLIENGLELSLEEQQANANAKSTSKTDKEVDKQ